MSAKLKLSIANWSPAIAKGIMWIASSALLALLSKLEGLTPDRLGMMTWVDWVVIVAFVGVQATNTGMAFLDQIIKNNEQKLMSEGKIPPPPNVEIKPKA
jgi:hypothetical protein